MEAKQLLSQSRSQLSPLKRPPPPHAVQLEKITLALNYYFTLIISECFELVGHFCFLSRLHDCLFGVDLNL